MDPLCAHVFKYTLGSSLQTGRSETRTLFALLCAHIPLTLRLKQQFNTFARQQSFLHVPLPTRRRIIRVMRVMRVVKIRIPVARRASLAREGSKQNPQKVSRGVSLNMLVTYQTPRNNKQHIAAFTTGTTRTARRECRKKKTPRAHVVVTRYL
jgi:hypothetical protein